MVRGRPLDSNDLTDRRFGEPRELREGDEEFPLSEEYPKTVARHVRHLNVGSVDSRILGSAAHVSPRLPGLARSLAPPAQRSPPILSRGRARISLLHPAKRRERAAETPHVRRRRIDTAPRGKSSDSRTDDSMPNSDGAAHARRNPAKALRPTRGRASNRIRRWAEVGFRLECGVHSANVSGGGVLRPTQRYSPPRESAPEREGRWARLERMS